MKTIKTIAFVVLLSVCGSHLWAADASSKANVAACVCVMECTSSKQEVKILNRRNRYTRKGAMQRRMFPRFMHVRIRPVKVVCACTVCHNPEAAQK